LIHSTKKIELLDHIVGNPDRNYDNLFFTFKDGKATGAKGLDNDMAFGPRMAEVDELAFATLGFAVRYSPIIDTAIYNDLMAKNESHLEQEAAGLAEPAGIEVAKHNLKRAQEYYKELRRIQDENPGDRSKRSIIEFSEWRAMIDDPRFTPKNCYITRSRTKINLPGSGKPNLAA
jgi:hypothetical protein